MRHIKCPEEFNFKSKEKSLFLAGGISNCAKWQDELVDMLKDENIILLNPRREFYDIKIKDLDEKQIKWEFKHMNKANAISFWFPKETDCPITLYELGTWTKNNKKIFIGIDPNYSRKKDVIIQTNLRRPEINIVYSMEELSKQIIKWSKNDG
jgi:hypothetical protein